jgi:membrane protease YdiL (CAAX protease family)
MIRLSDKHRATLRWIFTGADGIRAGWSIFIFLLIIAAAGGLLNLAGHLMHLKKHEGEVRPIFLFLAEAISISLVLGAGWIMGRIEKRSVWSYGLTGPHKLTNFLLGCAGGLASLSLVIGALYAGGYLVFDGVLLHGFAIPAYALAWLFVFFLVGVSEETMFRGYLQSTLTRGIGFWPGAVLMSALFAAAHIHNKGENILGIAQVFTAGMVLCLMLRVTGSLWMSIGFHTTWDWAQSYLYGVPDSAMMMQGHLLATHAVGNIQISGGTAGPEGSVFAPVGLILGPLVLVWLGRRLGVFGGEEGRPGGSAPWTQVGAVGPQTPSV